MWKRDPSFPRAQVSSALWSSKGGLIVAHPSPALRQSTGLLCPFREKACKPSSVATDPWAVSDLSG